MISIYIGCEADSATFLAGSHRNEVLGKADSINAQCSTFVTNHSTSAAYPLTADEHDDGERSRHERERRCNKT